MGFDILQTKKMQEILAKFAPDGYEIKDKDSKVTHLVARANRFSVHEPRDWQKAPIRDMVTGRNIIVQAKVGKGKSNIFASAIAKTNGLSYIIVPTIALGIDVAHHLSEAGAKVFVWSSVAKAREKKAFSESIEQYHAVILAPEAMQSVPITHNVSNLIIDEAHHIIMSNVYRSAFSDIGKFAHRINPKSIGLFSATFEESMIEEIQTLMFGFSFNKYLDKNPDRENIHYHAYDRACKKEDIINILKDNSGSAIIYAFSRNTVDATYFQMKKPLEDLGYNVLRYHSKITNKKEAMDIFQQKKTVVIATSAFGEGINKPDVGAIIRMGLPFNLLQMVQEAGRAMRDTKLGDGHYHLFTSHMDKLMFTSNIIDTNVMQRVLDRVTNKFEKFTYKDFMREQQLLTQLVLAGVVKTQDKSTVHYEIDFKKTEAEIRKGRAEYKFDIVKIMHKREWTQLELEEYLEEPKKTLQKAKTSGMLTYVAPKKDTLYKKERDTLNSFDIDKFKAKNKKIEKDMQSVIDFMDIYDKKQYLRDYFEGE